ncbi:response regulator [Flavobacterium sp.]|uniref:response regulator n=1 Tax=Flavobacterium sp. TaxID=239 RepID=UPI00286E7884|nr:response regulator [Flavobacterium sp.]
MKTQVNIFLAEDDADDQIFFEKVLSELPVSAKLNTFSDGKELMQYLDSNSYDDNSKNILFLDLSMPNKTGFECLIEIKENEKLKDLHVVMITCSLSKSIDFEQYMINTLTRMGADGFITKPDSYEELKKIIETTINRLI